MEAVVEMALRTPTCSFLLLGPLLSGVNTTPSAIAASYDSCVLQQ